MQGDREVIRHLNVILRNELTAIDQYVLHAPMFDNWGYGRPGDHERDESIDEMKHAVTREFFEAILESGEEHIDFLETQLKLIREVGVENDLQSQRKPSST